MGVKKLPTAKTLQAEYAELLSVKKSILKCPNISIAWTYLCCYLKQIKSHLTLTPCQGLRSISKEGYENEF